MYKVFILCCLANLCLSAQRGRDWGVERVSYKDPVSGYTITEITAAEAPAQNLYYHFPNFTADNRFVIFTDRRTGSAQIYRYDVDTGHIAQLTDAPDTLAGTACPHPEKANLLYYLRGPEVFELDILRLTERKVGEIPAPRTGGYGQPTLSHDRKLLALVKQRDANNWEIGWMEIATGKWTPVVTQGFRIGHVQAHPTLPLIFYVWETGGYAPQRTWLVNADGSANRPFFYEAEPKAWVTPMKEWVTHESWVPGGEEMTLVMDKVGVYVVGTDGKSRRFSPGRYWHVASRPGGGLLVTDDFDGNLWLLDPKTQNRKLIATGLREKARAVHAHASFDRHGRYVLTNTGRSRETVALVDLSSKK